MSVKIALLKSGEQIISDIKELISEEKVCGYLLINPHKVEIRTSLTSFDDNEECANTDLEVSLSPWIILSSDTQIPVSQDWIVTIVSPVETLKNMYEEKVNGKSTNQVSFVEE